MTITERWNIGVVGGGIAGLYAAIALQELGHTVTVLEGSDRLGGRIFSYHFKPTTHGERPFFEAGAMRIPLSSLHAGVFDFVRYLNEKGATQIEMIPYVLQHPNNLIYLGGVMVPCEDKTMSVEMDLPVPYSGMSARNILSTAMSPWIELLSKNFEVGFRELMRYEDLSFRRYLSQVAMMPDPVIDFVEAVMSQTNQYNLSFLELVMQTFHFSTPEWLTVAGGLTTIVEAAARHVDYRLNCLVTQIHERSDGRVDLTSDFTRTFDKVVLAIPPAAVQLIKERPRWSLLKEQAIRCIDSGPLYKMGIHFRTRFWEHLPSPSLGGQSQTDLRIRWVVYPSNDLGASGSGCLTLYCGMSDATKWRFTPRKERIWTALRDLNEFFRKQCPAVDVYQEYLDFYDVCWPDESITANTMYLPGQFRRFHDVMKQSEGNIFFAGEHNSRHHTWVAGAIDSAQEVVREISRLPYLRRLGQRVSDHANESWAEPVQFGSTVAVGIPILGRAEQREPSISGKTPLEPSDRQETATSKRGVMKDRAACV